MKVNDILEVEIYHGVGFDVSHDCYFCDDHCDECEKIVTHGSVFNCCPACNMEDIPITMIENKKNDVKFMCNCCKAKFVLLGENNIYNKRQKIKLIKKGNFKLDEIHKVARAMGKQYVENLANYLVGAPSDDPVDKYIK